MCCCTPMSWAFASTRCCTMHGSMSTWSLCTGIDRMLAYVIRRLWQFVPTLLGVMALVFLLFNWVRGDPPYLLAGKIPDPERIENIRRQLGVDQPWYLQFWIFMKQVATADFGVSWATNERVSAIFTTRLGPSLTVLVPMLVISTVLA